MKNSFLMDFKVEKENNRILIEREFAAAPSIVWRAFTVPEIIDLWWAPKPWKAVTKSMDFRDGGKWLYYMESPEGERHYATVEYIKINPETSFIGTDAFSDSEGNINKELPQSNWTVQFIPKENNTLVKYLVLYEDFEQLQATIDMGFTEGLRMQMENLDIYLEEISK